MQGSVGEVWIGDQRTAAHLGSGRDNGRNSMGNMVRFAHTRLRWEPNCKGSFPDCVGWASSSSITRSSSASCNACCAALALEEALVRPRPRAVVGARCGVGGPSTLSFGTSTRPADTDALTRPSDVPPIAIAAPAPAAPALAASTAPSAFDREGHAASKASKRGTTPGNKDVGLLRTMKGDETHTPTAIGTPAVSASNVDMTAAAEFGVPTEDSCLTAWSVCILDAASP